MTETQAPYLPATRDPILTLFMSNQKAIQSVLPKHLTPERMLRMAYTALQVTPKLRNCTPASLLNAVLEASMLGLEIGGPVGLAHLVPFGRQAQLIIGYQGYRELAYRSGQIVSFPAQPVYEKDHFEYAYGLNPKLEHQPSTERDRGKLIYAYAIAHFKGSGNDFEVVTEADAEAAKARSAAKFKKDSPWNNNDLVWTMWVKTAVRKLAKRLPKSPEFVRASMLDEYAEAGVKQEIHHLPLDAGTIAHAYDLSSAVQDAAQNGAEPSELDRLTAELATIKKADISVWGMGKMNAKIDGDEPANVPDAKKWLMEIEALQNQ